MGNLLPMLILSRHRSTHRPLPTDNSSYPCQQQIHQLPTRIHYLIMHLSADRRSFAGFA